MSTGLIDQILNYIADKLPVIGKVYSASWTAASSSASGTNLTGEVTLPAGTYIVVVQIPNASRSLGYMLTNISSTKNIYWTLAELTTGVGVFTITETTATRVRTAASASITWSNTARGHLWVVRIA